MATQPPVFPEEGAGVIHFEQKQEEPAKKPSWKGRIWDTFDRSPEERRLLFKVDAVILTFASIGYFLKNLDQTNVNSAFLSGMKEELGMYGNQLVTAQSIWTVGYVIGQLPSNLLLTRIQPRFVIPALELGWGIATLGSYAVKSYKSLYALRFLVGLMESGFYPGIHYLLGSWYTPAEIGKRAMIFWLAGSLGTMFSGFLQAAAYKNLSGIHGLEGWRWLFIIDAIFTLPLAIAGFFFFPPLPLTGKKSWWLTQEQFDLAATRLRRVGRAGKEPWSWPKLRRLLSSWHTYMLPVVYILWNNGYPSPPIGYWLKSFNSKPYPGGDKRYTVGQINTLPLPQTGIFVVIAIGFAWASDGFLKGNRWILIYIGAVITIIWAAVFRNFDLYANTDRTMIMYWFSSIGCGAGPLILTWINEICSDDSEKRALLVAGANDFAYVVQAIAPNFVWKTTDFPQAKKGWTYSAAMNAALIVWTTIVILLLKRDERRKKALEQREGGATPALPDSPHSAYIDEDGKSQRSDEDGPRTPDALNKV